MKQKLLILALAVLASLAVAPKAHAENDCANGNISYHIMATSASQVVTNTTYVRLCAIDLTCDATCTIRIFKHAGSTESFKTGLGAAGHRYIDFSGVKSGGKSGLPLKVPGLYFLNATGSTIRGQIYYVPIR